MNPVITQPKTLKQVRGGADKWALSHLPSEARIKFTNNVVPLARKKAGSLDPWENLTVEHVQDIMDIVFNQGKYKVSADNVFYGLVRSMLATLTYTDLIDYRSPSRLA